MCSHYEAVSDPRRLTQFFGVSAPASMGKADMWPKYQGLLLRRPPETDPHDEAVPAREALVGRWGLVPWRTTPAGAEKQLKLSTFNARDDRVAKAFTFSGAWQRAQHCIVPVEAFYEPDWRSGKAVATRFTRADGAPMGIAGLWDRWTPPGGEPMVSFTMLTINADSHPLLKDYHRPEDEKRMIVVLREDRYQEWLEAPAEASMAMLEPFAAEQLVATPIAAKKSASLPLG